VKGLLTNPQFWIRCAEIGFLNLLLSGDNAVVIALAVRALPGRQRLLGQIWGTVGAVVLRLGKLKDGMAQCAIVHPAIHLPT